MRKIVFLAMGCFITIFAYPQVCLHSGEYVFDNDTLICSETDGYLFVTDNNFSYFYEPIQRDIETIKKAKGKSFDTYINQSINKITFSSSEAISNVFKSILSDRERKQLAGNKLITELIFDNNGKVHSVSFSFLRGALLSISVAKYAKLSHKIRKEIKLNVPYKRMSFYKVFFGFNFEEDGNVSFSR